MPSDPIILLVCRQPPSSTCLSNTSIVLTLGLSSLGYFLHAACVIVSQQCLKNNAIVGQYKIDKFMMTAKDMTIFILL